MPFIFVSYLLNFWSASDHIIWMSNKTSLCGRQAYYQKIFLTPAKVFRLAYVVANNTSVKSELKQSILFFIIPNEPSQAQVEDVLDYSI